VQAVGIPVAERHHDYLFDLAARLRAEGVRVEVDTSDERMQKKIRNAQLEKVPFMLLVGDRDVENGAVSFRFRNGEQENGVPLDDAVARILDAIKSRVQV
jgi:threonyl-tRNA synthetase